MANYRITARGNKNAEIYLYDDIGEGWFGGITSKQVIDDIAALGQIDNLTVRINSPGGSVFEGLAIYNALKRSPANVIVEIDSICASIASVIAMAGDEIRIAENAMIMIHDPMSCAMGTAEDMRKTADSLDMVRDTLVNTYAARTKQSVDQISQWMGAETWMGAADAIKFGFADCMGQELKMAACIGLDRFKNLPNQLKGGEFRPQSAMRAARLFALLEKSRR